MRYQHFHSVHVANRPRRTHIIRTVPVTLARLRTSRRIATVDPTRRYNQYYHRVCMYTGSKEAPGLHRHICRYLLCLAGSISLPGLSELDHTIFKTYFVGLPEFPPETRHVSQVETWLLRPTKHLACCPPQSYPSRAEMPQTLAPQDLASQAMAGRGCN